MPDVTSYSPGTFCWVELSTSDWNAARKFYEDLFGWGSREIPMGEGTPPYVIVQKNGKDAGALYQQQKDQAGIPPNWLTYVSVASADETAKKAKSLGANVLAEPFDVFDSGRMAVLQDPQGAVFAVWQPNKHIGAGVRDEPSAFCWNELDTSDPKAALSFYQSLFGWRAKESKDYTEIEAEKDPMGGMMKIPPEWGPVPPNWLVYFAVDDCDRTVEKAKNSGGNVIVPPTSIPNAGRFAVIQDPQGAAFAVIKLTQ